MKFSPPRTAPILAGFLLWLVTAPAQVQAQEPAAAAAPSKPAVAEHRPLSGYMDFHFNKVDGQDAVVDFHRFVLLFAHQFTPRIRFVGELELEHALVEGLEEAGELELEQAYIDFLLRRSFNVRAGMLLVPVGIINERHEPPVYHGVERPLVDTFIVPTTWFEAGVGVHGEWPRGVRYRVYLMAPLDGLGFSADEGIRGGLQKGSESRARNAATTARVEYLGVPQLVLGLSTWIGHGNALDVPDLGTPVRMVEADARYTADRYELRAQFADVSLPKAGDINLAVGRLTGVDPNIATGIRGFYTEASYRVWNAGSPRDLVAFVRYENFDTQHRMPEGWLPLKEFDRDAWIAGVTYYPDPDVAVKFDVVGQRNQSGVVDSPTSFNIGLGWWF